MSSIQEIKRRIKAVISTSQITKAMEMVSATKMRRSQIIALSSRPYAIETLRLLSYLQTKTTYIPELMKPREIQKTIVVLITSDRGFAGAFNNNLIRAFDKFVKNINDFEKYFFVGVGKKAGEFFLKKNIKTTKTFKKFGDYVDVAETKGLNDFLVTGYLEKKWDQIITISTHFRTTLKQEVLIREILPIDHQKIWKAIQEIIPEAGRFSNFGELISSLDSKKYSENFEYLIEPNPKEILDALAPKLLEIIIYDLILEANASEHSARMVAMKNASENAEDLKNEFSLTFNKLRQSLITREINEIVSGTEAL